MNPDIQQLISDINAYIRNYGVEAFHNFRLQSILLRMVGLLGTLVGGGPLLAYSPIDVTSSNFSTSVDCPVVALNGINFDLYFNENSRFLILGIDYQALAGGGFTILIPNFDKAAGNYHFVLFPKN